MKCEVCKKPKALKYENEIVKLIVDFQIVMKKSLMDKDKKWGEELMKNLKTHNYYCKKCKKILDTEKKI